MALLTSTALAAAALAAASASPKPGHYAGATSENWDLTFDVTGHGRSVTGFRAEDGYNNLCHYSGAPPHLFHFIVKVPKMKVRRGTGVFTATVKAVEGPFTGTFRVKGKLSSTKARGSVTRLKAPCGAGASNPSASAYYETFTASRT